ncbi:hypothetical protein KP509_03G068500 [Ceratopteris richardii]|uniref:Uncharacterized protein n=1 Tax=Ceratopteris richardii TaxID=49495 RepID=A0A8T2V3T4_CERRI|nr:hypothetical protein KP509_03G068500 [Ceratopteris richardii]
MSAVSLSFRDCCAGVLCWKDCFNRTVDFHFRARTVDFHFRSRNLRRLESPHHHISRPKPFSDPQTNGYGPG